MSIELSCSGCGNTLRVGNEHAGKKARCPGCGAIMAIPTADQAASMLTGSAPTAQQSMAAGEGTEWYMKTPEGQVYGPVDKAEVDEWHREGRVNEECFLRIGVDGTWRNASHYFGESVAHSQPAVARSQPSFPHTQPTAAQQTPFDLGSFQSPAATPNPYAFSQDASHGAQRYRSPHRGGLVLALGILSWFTFCPLFGIIAWVMGSSDMAAVRSGRMDASGASMTQAGQVLGMISCILFGMFMAFFLLIALVG